MKKQNIYRAELIEGKTKHLGKFSFEALPRKTECIDVASGVDAGRYEVCEVVHHVYASGTEISLHVRRTTKRKVGAF